MIHSMTFHIHVLHKDGMENGLCSIRLKAEIASVLLTILSRLLQIMPGI